MSLENNDASTSNELFLERLDAFTAKTLADIRAFSARENIPYDQVGYYDYSPDEAKSKLLHLRFGVTSQRNIPSTSLVTQLPPRTIIRTVRL